MSFLADAIKFLTSRLLVSDQINKVVYL